MQRAEKKSDLELAKETLAKVKAAVKTTHDVIPYQQLPFFVPGNMQDYVVQFGEEKIETYLQHLQKHDLARTNIQILFAKYKDQIESPVSTCTTAVSYCGVGECHESASRALLELGLLGCTSHISMIGIQGKEHSRTGKVYNHAFLIIGNSSALKLGASMNVFDKLPNGTLLVDPFLNIVAPGYQFRVLLKEYLAMYEIDSIDSIMDIDPLKVDFTKLKTNAVKIAIELQKMTNTSSQEVSPGIASSFAALYSVSTKKDKIALVSLSKACNKIAKGYDIMSAFDKSKSLGFRTACYLGNEEIISILIDSRSVFPDLNINESSGSKQRTALDWIQFNTSLSDTEKAALSEKLKAAGGKSYAEVSQPTYKH